MAPKFDIRRDEKVKVINATDWLPAGGEAYIHSMRVGKDGDAEYLLRKEKKVYRGSRFSPLGTVKRNDIERVRE